MERDNLGKLAGKVGLVTGASKGIGLGIAKALAGEGCGLVLVARGEAALRDAADKIARPGVDVIVHAADVTSEAQVDAVFDHALAHFNRLDLLVNNAGAFDGGPIDELPVDVWDKVINTNLRAPFLCTRRAMRCMKQQGGGRIINIGSISAQRVRPNASPYGASKHALWGLTQSTALEGRDHGITCCCLHPGNIFVERRAASDKPEDTDEPMMSVEEISEVALLMATLPAHVAMLETIVLPNQQLYVGRG